MIKKLKLKHLIGNLKKFYEQINKISSDVLNTTMKKMHLSDFFLIYILKHIPSHRL